MTKYWQNKPRIKVLTVCRSKTNCIVSVYSSY